MRGYVLTIIAFALMPTWIFVEWLRGNMSDAAVIAASAPVAVVLLSYLTAWLAKTIWRRKTRRPPLSRSA